LSRDPGRSLHSERPNIFHAVFRVVSPTTFEPSVFPSCQLALPKFFPPPELDAALESRPQGGFYVFPAPLLIIFCQPGGPFFFLLLRNHLLLSFSPPPRTRSSLSLNPPLTPPVFLWSVLFVGLHNLCAFCAGTYKSPVVRKAIWPIESICNTLSFFSVPFPLPFFCSD